MAWSVASSNTLEQGQWATWTANWNNGTGQWGASQMTQGNHRWTKVGGCLYAHGKLSLESTSNFGTGTGTWTLWFPSEWGSFADTNSGGRFVGEGWAAGYFRGLHFNITMINTFDGFAVPIFVQHIGMAGNFNAGVDNTYAMNRDKLYWISNEGASPISIYYQLRFITNPNT